MPWLRLDDRPLTGRESEAQMVLANMNVLILGSGCREHALAVALAASPSVGKVYVSPGKTFDKR